MILSVTVLGSNDGTALSVIGQRIVEYLEGGRSIVGGRRPGALVELPSPEGGTVAYYADSAGLRPGRWVLGRSGEVDPAELAMLLAGRDPATGEPLISARGSSGRAERWRRLALAPTRLDKEWYSTKEAASVLGITPSYLRRLLRERVAGSADESEGIKVDSSGAWQINKDAVVRLSEHRQPPKVVAGYDLTFSVPKSVSVLWAGADDATRAAVLEALDEAVAGGLRYLERQAFKVSVRKHPLPASGIVAADYLHTTSRALEPQLHHHVVVANFGVGPDGVARALDAALRLPPRQDGELPRRSRVAPPADRPACRHLDGGRERHRRDRGRPRCGARRDELAGPRDRRSNRGARRLLGPAASGGGVGHPRREGARRRPRRPLRLVGRAPHRRRLRP